MKKIIITLTIATAVLAGCGEKTATQTVDWYKAHETERTAMIAKCKNDASELATSANCINATKAKNQLTLGNRTYRERAPMDASEGSK
jgi:predicted Fe-S protein YdhL (DUF1289 family)